jgi:hypothetical protein
MGSETIKYHNIHGLSQKMGVREPKTFATRTDSIEPLGSMNAQLLTELWMFLYRLGSHGCCVGGRAAGGCAERFFVR